MRSYREVRWPFKGLHVGRSYHGQAHDTTVDCENVRNEDPTTGRSRGAQRAGLSRYVDAQASGTGNKQIQDLNSIITVPSTAASLTNLQARTQTNICVCAGNVQSFTTSAISNVTNGASALSATAPVIFSTQLFDTIYFADGTSQKKYTVAAGVAAWAAASGSFPSSGANLPRLIEMWRTRIVMSGLKGDEHNWFMSKAGDATDFDYTATTAVAAVSGSNADAGKVGDIVNAIIPYDDDTLIFGCDHSIWQMSGDPADGGDLDEITDVTGMAFGRPYARSYDGSVYFLGSRGGIYKMFAGQKPERLSEGRLDELLDGVDLNQMIVRAVYDDRTIGVHFFLTNLDQSASTHYYYDIKQDAFFKDTFVDPLYNPVAVLQLDGDDEDDRCVLIGGFDRRIREIDYDAKDDDQEAIESYVYLGPLRADQGGKIHLKELIGILDDACDGAYYEVYAAQGSQIAYSRGQKYFSGWWKKGRNGSDSRRAGGTAIYIKLGNFDSNSSFAMETIMAAIEQAGITAGRQVV